jgi:hypothetical protein
MNTHIHFFCILPFKLDYTHFDFRKATRDGKEINKALGQKGLRKSEGLHISPCIRNDWRDRHNSRNVLAYFVTRPRTFVYL